MTFSMYRPRHLRPSPTGQAIRVVKYLAAWLFGVGNIVLFSQTFISAVAWHRTANSSFTPGQVALISLGPLEFFALVLVTYTSWRTDRTYGPTRLLCCTLGGECALNWTIFILGGGLLALTLGI